MPSAVLLTRRLSNAAPLRAASTNLRHSGSVVGGNSAARRNSSLIGGKWHSPDHGAIALAHRSTSGQAMDALGVDGPGGLVDTAPFDHTVAGDFGQRQQNEGTLE